MSVIPNFSQRSDGCQLRVKGSDESLLRTLNRRKEREHILTDPTQWHRLSFNNPTTDSDRVKYLRMRVREDEEEPLHSQSVNIPVAESR